MQETVNDELYAAQIKRLENDAQAGQVIRAFCQHPGFKLYREAIEAIIADRKNAWLKGSDEVAREERVRAQGVQKALDVLKQFILVGENSARILAGDEPNKSL
jgi:hypothetical protein